MKTAQLLSEDQKQVIMNHYESSTPDETTPLDPSNPDHNKFIRTMLNVAGRTPERYPHVYNALEGTQALQGPQGKDKVHMVDAGQTKDGKATATIWSGSNHDSMIKGGNLVLMDGDTNEVLAHGDNTAVRSGFLTCPTRGASAKNANNSLKAMYMGHVTEGNGHTRFFSYANAAAVGSGTGIQATVEMPVSQTGSINTPVLIAVGRTGYGSLNADYLYAETSGLGNNPFLITPFKGNVALSGLIDINSFKASDINTNIIIDNTTGPAENLPRDTQFTTDADVVAAFKDNTTQGSNVLAWEFPYDGIGHGNKNHTNTKSIVYDHGSLTSEKISYFYFAFNNIPFTNGGSSDPFYVCSKDSPEEKSNNCTVISQMKFWWHCLEDGTMITLEDGSQMPIEEINETHRVQVPGSMNSLQVRATVRGLHQSTTEMTNRDGIFRLTTENGKTITATECHTLLTPSGDCRMICYIGAGEEIMTDEGPSIVISNEVIDHEAMFHGLILGNEEELAHPDFPHNSAGFYANGVLSADHEAMNYHAADVHHDLDYMLARIHTDLHEDYASALSDKRF